MRRSISRELAIPDHQDWLMDRMASAGYDAFDRAGICLGVGIMASQAALVAKLSEYNTRLERIASLSLNDFAAIAEFRKRETNVSKEAFEVFAKEKNLPPWLNWHTVVDILTYFESTLICQSDIRSENERSENTWYQDLLGKTDEEMKKIHQSDMAGVPFVVNNILWERGGIVSRKTIDYFTDDSLVLHLLTLMKLVESKKDDLSVTLLISGVRSKDLSDTRIQDTVYAHVFNISYDRESDQWKMIDANKLKEQDIHQLSSKELVEKIKERLFIREKVFQLKLTLQSPHDEEKKLDDFISHWILQSHLLEANLFADYEEKKIAEKLSELFYLLVKRDRYQLAEFILTLGVKLTFYYPQNFDKSIVDLLIENKQYQLIPKLAVLCENINMDLSQALEQAILVRQKDLIVELLKCNINLNMPISFNGKSGWEVAYEKDKDSLTGIFYWLLVTTKKIQEALFVAVQANNLPMVEALLKLGANPNYIEHDESALHIAVASNDEKMVGKLIEYGGNIDLKTQVTKKDLEQIADTRWDNSGYNMIRFFQRKHQEVKTTTDLHDQPVKKDILPTKTPK